MEILVSYIIMFIGSFVAATVFPFPSEAYYVALVFKTNTFLLPTLFATLGNGLGAITTFMIGRKGGEWAEKKFSSKNKKRYEQAVQYLKKHGAVTLIFSFLPLLGDMLVAIGGAMKLPIKTSIFWMSLGKFLRYSVLGLGILGFFS